MISGKPVIFTLGKKLSAKFIHGEEIKLAAEIPRWLKIF